MKQDIFSALLTQLEDSFLELDSNITTALPERDEQYAALKKRLADLERRYPFIESVLDGKGEVHLTAAEHAGLVEYLRATDDAENRERLNLYLAGHRDCFAYLKRIGLM
jgi:hypothetical protein